MKLATLLAFAYLLELTAASIIDVYERTNGHEPRVAISCGRVPFSIDIQTGKWLADSTNEALCDGSKPAVKKFCQTKYPKLNITNIVEANEPVTIKSWCKPGNDQCNEEKEVIPYRCLVNEYEADALMVPAGCKFDHIHDQNFCLNHDQWKKKAENKCLNKYVMKLKDYGILLSCDVDFFTGVEFVCCPKRNMKPDATYNKIKKLKKEKKPHEKRKLVEEAGRESFLEAIRKFMNYLPPKTNGCDRSTYIKKQTELEDAHRQQIDAVVNEWDGTERRYLQLKAKDPEAAEEKMKRTLEVFRQTLAALENESKEEKNRLRAEHAECINTEISKEKRTAMIEYIGAIQEEPVNAETILTSVRNFIQVCEHDRVHSLRHFEHVRNRDAKKADALRGQLLQHLKDLNKVVNESMSLLNYLPDIAQEFGLGGQIGGAILRPRLVLPTETHTHEEANDVLNNAEKKFYETEHMPMPGDEDEDEDEDEDLDATDMPDILGEDPEDTPIEEDFAKKIEATEKIHEAPKPKPHTEPKVPEKEETPILPINPLVDPKPETTETDMEVDDREEGEESLLEKLNGEVKTIESEVEAQRSPFAFTVIMGLSGGVLVIMLFIIIAMVMRRHRANQGRVVITENDDERDHLVEMQKNGFENPTYKFFYY